MVLYADSTRAGATLSADVVRIGGGAGLIDRGGGVHDRPMFELCSRYHAQLAGAPLSVYATAGSDRNDDISTRSRFAAWDHEPGEGQGEPAARVVPGPEGRVRRDHRQRGDRPHRGELRVPAGLGTDGRGSRRDGLHAHHSTG